MVRESFFDVLRARFPSDPSVVAIETLDGRRLTYGELLRVSGQVARLLAERGLGRRDRVAARVESSPEAVCLYLACLRSGLVYVPLSRALTGAELGAFIDDAEPHLTVCAPEDEGALREMTGGEVLTLDGAGGGSLIRGSRELDGDFATAWVTREDNAAFIYTSGTTGRSKGAMLTQGNLTHNCLVLSRAWGFSSDDVLIHALPLHHVHGLFVACGCALAAGARMVMLPRFDPGEVVRQLPRATALMGVPTFYTRLLSHPGLNRQSCATMRLFVSGSAPLRAETFREFAERTGHRILERYGMTETLITLSNPLDGERRPGTVGLPLRGIAARVVGEGGQGVGPGEVGQLEVRGPSVSPGYWRRPEATAEAFRDDGFFVTGDLVRRDEDGYLSIVGRARDLVITGGENVYPREVEVVLDGLEGVAESAVIGLPHADYGEAVTAVVVPTDPEAPPEADTLRAELRAKLAGYKVPKRVIFVDELPRNVMGKVQKNVLRERWEPSLHPPLARASLTEAKVGVPPSPSETEE